ncbi:helix-turn-helix transcriptional regulator [Actinomadura meridiana]|uniref:Helix-turn-helix transcriptional regulator n=1 Tax=Actinomadura meridiana TaxID=559626 RepID=A0ABP8BZ81_9ACTN
MALRDALDPDRSIWHFIAVHLRRYREANGLSGQALGDLLDCDRSTVSRYESGLLKIPRKHAKIVDRVWQTEGMFTALIRFAEQAADGDWLIGLAEYEKRATRIRLWEALLIPGLLQTEDYARAAILRGVAEDPEETLRVRMQRRADVFDKDKPPRFTAFLNWTVLAQPVGPPEVMRKQIAHLIEMSDLPHVSLRVVERTAGAHPGLDGSFKIVTVDDRELAYVEAATRGRFLMDPYDLQEVAVRYDLISDIAAPVGPSRTLLEQALESYT